MIGHANKLYLNEKLAYYIEPQFKYLITHIIQRSAGVCG